MTGGCARTRVVQLLSWARSIGHANKQSGGDSSDREMQSWTDGDGFPLIKVPWHRWRWKWKLNTFFKMKYPREKFRTWRQRENHPINKAEIGRSSFQPLCFLRNAVFTTDYSKAKLRSLLGEWRITVTDKSNFMARRRYIINERLAP